MKSSRGFTLLEVVVATALTAGAVLAVMTMSITAYERVNRNGLTTSALAVAQQHIEWLRSQPYTSDALAAGTTTEELAGIYDGYTRTTTVEDNTPMAGIKRITVRAITWSGRSVQLVSLIAE